MHSCWLTSGIVRSLVTPRGSLLISSALTDFQEKVPEWTQQKPLGELQLHRLVWVIKPTQPSCPPLTGGQICHTALLYVLLGHLFSITSWSSAWSVDLKVRLVNRFTVKAEMLSQNEVWMQKYPSPTHIRVIIVFFSALSSRSWAPREKALCCFLLISYFSSGSYIAWFNDWFPAGEGKNSGENEWMEEKRTAWRGYFLLISLPFLPFHLTTLIFSSIYLWIMESPTKDKKM